jgi:DNA gyrase inhibitor GyrI
VTRGVGEVGVEFGVGVTAHFAPAGLVQFVELPTGTVATVTHWGDYARLGEAHAAVIAWRRTQGHELAGPRWELYGHWSHATVRRVRTSIIFSRGRLVRAGRVRIRFSSNAAAVVPP